MIIAHIADIKYVLQMENNALQKRNVVCLRKPLIKIVISRTINLEWGQSGHDIIIATK